MIDQSYLPWLTCNLHWRPSLTELVAEEPFSLPATIESSTKLYWSIPNTTSQHNPLENHPTMSRCRFFSWFAPPTVNSKNTKNLNCFWTFSVIKASTWHCQVYEFQEVSRKQHSNNIILYKLTKPISSYSNSRQSHPKISLVVEHTIYKVLMKTVVIMRLLEYKGILFP